MAERGIIDKMRILIVDDDEEMCEELKTALEAEGYLTRTVYDGKKAHQVIQEDGYEVILLDLKMPKLNGRAVLKYIKTKRKDIKVIILTGTPLSKKLLQEEDKTAEEDRFAYDKDEKYAVLKLADSIMGKPLDIEKMIFKIKSLVEE